MSRLMECHTMPPPPGPARLALRAFAAVALCHLPASPASVARAQALTPEQDLGRRLFFDASLSTPPGQSCASCHAPEAGFTSPDEAVNTAGAVVPGATGFLAGPRKPPSVAYAAFSPRLAFNAGRGAFAGGQFWDGRVDDLVEQAKLPLLNPLEMNNPNARAVVRKVRMSPYAGLFARVYGPGALDRVDTDRAFDLIARALAAYESSPEVVPFSSKYDAFLAGEEPLDDGEARGLALFEGRANCATCHPSRPGPDGAPPLFTRFGYHNLGVPSNPENPFYAMPPPVNPAGPWFVDLGLGGSLGDPAQDGRMKVPSLRNVDLRPGEGFVKAYMHNGAFKSLEEVVHFYNARDLGGFAPAEVPATVNAELLGDLGLTDAEEGDLVAFLGALSDGYRSRRPGPRTARHDP
jgi:cytochrome c peroxidase